MNVLVAVASKHGSTREIAQTITDELTATGIDAEVRDIDDSITVNGYDAAVIGSAIYMGNWLREARQFVQRNEPSLTTMPVWLFSSGPLGDEDPQPKGDPNHLDALLAASGARGHQIFVGKLDTQELGIKERLIVRMVNAPEGDFRKWEAIRSWARDIAAALSPAMVDAQGYR